MASPSQKQRSSLSLHTHTAFIVFNYSNRLLDTWKTIGVIGFRVHIFNVITLAASRFWEFWKMLEDQVAYLLQRYLGNYVRGLNKEALKISVWQGHQISLYNSRYCRFPPLTVTVHFVHHLGKWTSVVLSLFSALNVQFGFCANTWSRALFVELFCLSCFHTRWYGDHINKLMQEWRN